MVRFRRGRGSAPEDSWVVAALRPFTFTARALPPSGQPLAREVLPGLLATVVVSHEQRVDFLPPESVAQLGGADEVWRTALRNQERHPGPQVELAEATPGNPETVMRALGSEDVFAASNLADLDRLRRVAFGAAPPRFGWLVTAPYWRLMLLHELRGGGGLVTLSRVAAMADEVVTSPGVPPRERLTSDVHYVAPDGRTQVVARSDSGGVVVETRGLIRDHYFVPNGLLGPEG